MEETISLKELFEVLRKRILLIIACIVCAALIAATVSFFFLTPKYESSSQFIVNQKHRQSNAQFDVNDIQTNVELINTYNVIIKSKAILDDVVKELKLPYDAAQLDKKVQVSSEQDSQVVTVNVTDTDHARASKIANTTVEIFQKKTPQIMNGVDNITILTKAEEQTNPSPVAPKPALNMAIAIVLGAMIGVGIAFLLDYLDTTITTEEDIKKQLELPVLGVITTITDQDILGNQDKLRSTKRRRGRLNVSQKKTS